MDDIEVDFEIQCLKMSLDWFGST